MDIKKVLVVGSGTMGSGIAQVCSQAGLEVKLKDVSEDLVKKGISGITKGLDRLVEKGRIKKEQRDTIIGRIEPITDYEKAKDCDLVIEAVFELMDVKQKVFAELDSIIPQNVILASNTSGLPITEIATATKRPDKVIGTHFFNPVPVMRLVEVIKGYKTSDETCKVIEEFCKHIGKVPVCVNDCTGFVTVRVMMPMIQEAITTYTEGIASIEAIDTAMKLGFNLPMGPFELADLIGLDVCLHCFEELYEGYGHTKFFPPTILKKMVVAGDLGRKTGKGFYDYTKK